MEPHNVVSPISLPPTELERFQKRWVSYLEREGITTHRQPTEQEVREWCYVADVPLADAVPLPVDEEESSTADERAIKEPPAPILTPEQRALAVAPWTADDVAAWKEHCAHGNRGDSDIYPERYTAREMTNFIRARRGVPLLPPDPPPPPMRWHFGEYGGRRSAQDYEPQDTRNSRFGSLQRPGS
jgi:hypothetical protein